MKRKLLKKLSSLTIATLLLSSFFVFITPSVLADSSGLNNGSTFVDDNSTGSYSWLNPSYAQTSNNSYATVTLSNSGQQSHYLKATGFGFSIMDGATINGIEVQIERHRVCVDSHPPCTSNVNDNRVRLVKSGTIGTTDRANSVDWPTTDTIITYGGPADLWGTSWTVSDINNISTGVVLSAKRTSGGDQSAWVDHIVMKVYYTPANTPPTITEGASTSVTMSEDGSPTPFSLTLHATDPDPDTLTWSISSAASHGTATASGTGTSKGISYTPVADYNGTDAFTVQVSDGHGGTDTIVVNVTIDSVNDAPVAVADSYSTDEDTPLDVAAPGVLSNDTDVDGDSLTAVVVDTPTHGSLTFNGDGSFTYTPDADYNGSDSLTYKANDGNLDSNTVTVDFTINPVNDAPVAADDNYTTSEDTALNVVAIDGVLANDTDAENDSLTAAEVAAPAHGTLTLNADGSFDYVPVADYNGPDSFTYTAYDGTTNSNVATVSITVTSVNDAPVANNDSYSTDEDTALNVAAAEGVLANDTDADGDSLTAAVVDNVTHGSLTLNSDGSFDYTPDADYNGSDSFTYKANDGTADSPVATVTIAVNSVNDVPVAVNDSYSIDEDQTLIITAPGVLGKDTDADGDSLTAAVVDNVTHGSLTLNADGSFTYTPDADYNGSDSFTYKANDGTADSGEAVVSLTVNPVNDLPTGADKTITINEDTPYTFNTADFGFNDVDVGDSLAAVRIETLPAAGSLTNDGAAVNASDSINVSDITGNLLVFTPAANENGTDYASFTFSVEDSADAFSVAPNTITFDVNAVNDAPVANNASVTTDYNTAKDIILTATDVDGDTLTYYVVDNPSHGVLSGTVPDLTYTPGAGYSGSDSFTFKANDGDSEGADSNIATISITVNSAPAPAPETPSGGGGGGGSFTPTPCFSVEYYDWKTCIDGWQYRDIKALVPEGCAITETQRDAGKQACGQVLGEQIIPPTEGSGQVLGVKLWPDGSLLRWKGDMKVWLITNSMRYHILNWKELWDHYRGWVINNVSQAEVEQYPILPKL